MTLTAPRTQNEVIAAIRAMGWSCSVRNGEYRITDPEIKDREARESAAYYTDDREDAFYTAVKMTEDTRP